MSDQTNEWLEREARESLVAADLSAKMQQWRNQSPPPKRRGKGIMLLILLIFCGAAAWWFWPKTAEKPQPILVPPTEQPAPKLEQTPTVLPEQQQSPVAQKPAVNRYLAVAQSHYQAPNFVADIRGDAPAGQDALNTARQALANRRFADALDALKNVPDAYQTDANYLRGHALFGLKKYGEAAAVFGQLAESVRYGEAAQWYEVLALLPDFEQNKSLIMRCLHKVTNDEGHTFQREAQRLAAEL